MLASKSRIVQVQGLWGAVRYLATSQSQHNAAMVNFSNDSQTALVNMLVQHSLVVSPRVEEVLRALDRRDFTFAHLGMPAHISYSDCTLPIGQGQSISAPSLHAVCLELLEEHMRPGARVLDVGSGSGYLTGCFSLLVGPHGRVVALERHERLVEQAGWALARALSPLVGDLRPTLELHRQHQQQRQEEKRKENEEEERQMQRRRDSPVGQHDPQRGGQDEGGRVAGELQGGDAASRNGERQRQRQQPLESQSEPSDAGARASAVAAPAPAELPAVRMYNLELLRGNALDDGVLAAVAADGLYDAIHVGCSVREVPEGLVALLRPGGRLLLPVGPPVARQMLTVVDKALDGSTSSTAIRDVKLPPLALPNAEKPL